VPKNIVTPLAVDSFHMPVQLSFFFFQGEFTRTKVSDVILAGLNHTGHHQKYLFFTRYGCFPVTDTNLPIIDKSIGKEENEGN
jgi:hypothetical protein